MNETTEILFKTTFFNEEQRIILDADYIEFYKSSTDKNPVKFSKLEIDAFRFGIKWISGYKFYIGRIYCIDIKNVTGTIIKIRLKSIYKIRVKELHAKYSLILNTVLNYYFSEVINQYVKLFNRKESFSILNIQFNQSDILIDNKQNINWNEVDVRGYTRYIAVSTRKDSGIYKAFDYVDDWNVWILYNVLRQILRSKNLLTE